VCALVYHHEQGIVQIFTHMKRMNLTLLTSKLYKIVGLPVKSFLHI